MALPPHLCELREHRHGVLPPRFLPGHDTGPGRHPHWLLFVFPGEVEISGLRLYRTHGETVPRKYYLEATNDGGATFQRLLTCEDEIPADTLCAEHQFRSMQATAARLVILESACEDTPDACHLQSLQLLGRLLRVDSGFPEPVDGLRSEPDLSAQHLGEPYAQVTVANPFMTASNSYQHQPFVFRSSVPSPSSCLFN